MILKPGNRVYVARSNESLQTDFIELKSILKSAGIEVISYSGKHYDHDSEMRKVNQCHAFIMLPPNPLITDIGLDDLDDLAYHKVIKCYIGKGIGQQFEDCVLKNRFLYLSVHNDKLTTLDGFEKTIKVPPGALYAIDEVEDVLLSGNKDDWKYYYEGYFEFAYYIEDILENINKKPPTDDAEKPNSDPLTKFFLGK